MLQGVAFQLICMVVFFQQASGEDVNSVIGYIGESVFLRPHVDPSWDIKNIQWSIYKNSTLIATFENNVLKVERVAQFKGRLELNIKSGDLKITKLKATDSMEYTVHIENSENNDNTSRVRLSVREQIPEPEITVLHSCMDKGKCIISLKCSILSIHISLLWKPEHGFSEHFYSSSANATGESVMWTSFSNRSVNFSCIATDGNHNKSSQRNLQCLDPNTSCCSCIWLALFIIALIAIPIVLLLYRWCKANPTICMNWMRNLPRIQRLFSRCFSI
ncbi:SLAM family member 5 [Silurus meridionalis]|uniref:Ig-like domain-containing protein n=1 Tax=Silurus meridionalis TaxID=175797 RepID=A0A8T0BHS6_SILME|nr:SLAM family member 5 [Silurus meridionalis]KAF7706649.1 hypothetical protein HF521_019903 [Silurus meridionalis]